MYKHVTADTYDNINVFYMLMCGCLPSLSMISTVASVDDERGLSGWMWSLKFSVTSTESSSTM